MAEPITYEQIVQEIKAKRALKPWEVSMPAPAPRAESPEATGAAQMAMVDPLKMAAQRELLMKGLASSFGTMANPETQQANVGKRPDPGLIQLLMSLMGK